MPSRALAALSLALLASPGRALLLGSQGDSAGEEEPSTPEKPVVEQQELANVNVRHLPAMQQLRDAFGGVENFFGMGYHMCGKCVSEDDQDSIVKANNEKDWSAGIYGEIKPKGVVHLFERLKAKPGQRYYDLGSGAGKTATIAARLFGMKATGVELSRDRHEAGCEALEHLRAAPRLAAGTQAPGRVQLVRGSFFDYDISDADIVFMDSVEFTEEMMERLAELCQSLRPGAKIVTFKAMPGLEARELRPVHLETSWSPTSFQVLEKTSEARLVRSLPAASTATESCSA